MNKNITVALDQSSKYALKEIKQNIKKDFEKIIYRRVNPANKDFLKPSQRKNSNQN